MSNPYSVYSGMTICRRDASVEIVHAPRAFQTAFERWHSEQLPARRRERPACKKKRGRTRTAASVGSFGNTFEELSGASIFAFVEGKVGFLQNWRNLMCKCFSLIATEHAAH